MFFQGSKVRAISSVWPVLRMPTPRCDRNDHFDCVICLDEAEFGRFYLVQKSGHCLLMTIVLRASRNPMMDGGDGGSPSFHVTAHRNSQALFEEIRIGLLSMGRTERPQLWLLV